MVNTIWFRTATRVTSTQTDSPQAAGRRRCPRGDGLFWRVSHFMDAMDSNPLRAACVCVCVFVFVITMAKMITVASNTKPASGMSGHRAGDSNYVTRAAWGHILRDIMVSWSFHWTNILKYYYLGERMTSSLNIVVIHSVEEWGHRWPVNTTEPWVTLFSLFLSLR